MLADYGVLVMVLMAFLMRCKGDGNVSPRLDCLFISMVVPIVVSRGEESMEMEEESVLDN